MGLASKVPDSLKTSRYWEIQMTIAKANARGDDILELSLLDEQNEILLDILNA